MEQYPNTTIPEREPTFKSESCNSSLYLSPSRLGTKIFPSLAGSVNPRGCKCRLGTSVDSVVLTLGRSTSAVGRSSTCAKCFGQLGAIINLGKRDS
ncbi:hypothetical protein CDAR_100881 [Caerostris darwini]|uniref:Uncharacterized protein n=1 Tax=Caerostris darwini TaxID=1538125 RepID=A0AAV4VV64_9ARAC|nr:hypothetical protein CDAR_100881 [Caerostris darwini]